MFRQKILHLRRKRRKQTILRPLLLNAPVLPLPALITPAILLCLLKQRHIPAHCAKQPDVITPKLCKETFFRTPHAVLHLSSSGCRDCPQVRKTRLQDPVSQHQMNQKLNLPGLCLCLHILCVSIDQLDTPILRRRLRDILVPQLLQQILPDMKLYFS